MGQGLGAIAPPIPGGRVPDMARAAAATRVDMARATLPPIDRPHASPAILDITKWFGETSGGVKTYLTEKMRWVRTRPDVRHALVIPGPFDGITTGVGTRAYRVRGPRIPTQTAYRFLFATRSLRRIIAHEAPSVIEVGSPLFVPWVTAFAARGLGIPLVAFHHTSFRGAVRAHGRSHGPWRPILDRYARVLDRLFHLTIVASEFAAQELAAMGVTNTARVPLGVDLELFYPARKAERERTLRRLGLPMDRPIGLYVGRLAREKRLDVVLDAWVNVERACGAHLMIAGAGSEEAALRARCPAQRVTWLPFQHDRDTVARLHAAADIFVAPGEVETFGLSALEALASGTPVVAPAAGAVAEQVTRSGAGRLYEPGSSASCAHAVRQLLGEDRSLLALQARAYAEREHDWSRVFERLLDVYRSVMHATPRLDP